MGKEEKEYAPKWLYHKEKGSALVKSEKEEKELGTGWKDSPADFDQEAVVEKDDSGKEKVVLKAKAPKKAKK